MTKIYIVHARVGSTYMQFPPVPSFMEAMQTVTHTVMTGKAFDSVEVSCKDKDDEKYGDRVFGAQRRGDDWVPTR